MKTDHGRRIPYWAHILLSILVLLICLFYTFTAVYLSPYPGFEWDAEWAVCLVEPCDANPAWCEANQGALRTGDRILVIGDLTHDEVMEDRSRAPFAGYRAGDTVPITFLRDGEKRTVDWQLLGHTSASRARHLLGAMPLYVPFWLVGTIALFFFRPHPRSDASHWRLSVAFNYMTAIWLALGAFGTLATMYRSIMAHALAWLLVPVYLHFHLTVPSPLFQRHRRYCLPSLYAVAAILAIFELFQVLPYAAFTLALLLAFLSSVSALILRLLAKHPASDRPTAALMLAGILLSLGPPIILWAIPTLLHTAVPTGLSSSITTLAVPLLPFFYVYAIYKRRLGSLEHRVKRALGLYGFLLIYVTAIVALLSIGGYWLGTSATWVIFSGTAWTALALAALPLYTRFQRLTARLAYGTAYNPQDIMHTFATRVRALLDHEEWIRTLPDELASSLLIRQSALCLLTDGSAKLVYSQGVEGDASTIRQQIQQLLTDAGRYRPPLVDMQDGLDWVRLAIPLEIRGRTAGVWLFGQRDPDDYYPASDIKLLTTLASQVAVAVENDRLYDQALQEIAKRKRVEEALRESEERLCLVVQNMPVMLDALDADNNIIVWNRECERVTGYSTEEIVGNPKALELLYPDADYLQRVMTEWGERGSDFRHWELELTAKDGSVKTVEWFNISEQFPIPGWATWAIGVDVTEHRQAERELRIKDSAIASSISAIAIADLEGKLVYVNQAFLEYWGYDSDEEILGREAVGFWQSREEAQEIVEALRSGEGWVGELVARRKDGSLFDVELAATLVTDEAGRPTCMMGSFLDITQRKRAEQQVVRAERVAAMGQMAAALAHEVNNPLQTVRSNLELLQDFDLDPDEHRQRLGIALKEIERLAGITRRVLDFVQPSKDTLRAVPITELAHRALTLMAEQLELAHVEVTIDLPPDPLHVLATPSQIVQVLLNLITNTIEALPNGGHLCISGYRNRNDVVLDLINDGPHLTPEQATRLFDPFFTTKQGGAGLGLYTSRIIIARHRGTISARNLEGEQGVAFTITLPTAQIPDEQETPIT